MRGGSDRAQLEFDAPDPDRRGRVLDVAFALLAGGVLLGLPAFVWVLGIY